MGGSSPAGPRGEAPGWSGGKRQVMGAGGAEATAFAGISARKAGQGEPLRTA